MAGVAFLGRDQRSTASLEAQKWATLIRQSFLFGIDIGRAGPQCGCCTPVDPDGLCCDQLQWRAVTGLDFAIVG
jgi:hypothetical protein